MQNSCRKRAHRTFWFPWQAKEPFLVAASGEVFEAPAPKGKLINGVGAGDSMVAGFMAGYMEKEDYLHAFHMGIAAGSASAFSENLATREEIASVYEQITK